jgi:RND family efflux transporter MFP subunit
MKRKWVLWIVITALAFTTVGGYYLYTARDLVAAQAEETAIPQAEAQLGSLIVSTSGSGTLVPAAEVTLGFQDSGVIVEMNVVAGTEVKAGEVLARLQVDKTPNELAAELASAELAVIEAQQTLGELYENAVLETAQALTALETAQQALDDLKDNDLELTTAQQVMTEAQQAVADAEMQVYILTSSPSQEARDIAHASLLFKEKKLAEMEKRISRLENQIKIAPNKMIWEQLRKQLQDLKLQLLEMQGDYENRLYRYEHMDDPADPVELAAAQAQLTTAQAQLEQAQRDWEDAQAGPNQGELAKAESDLAQAQEAYERLKDGPDAQEITMAKAALAAAQAKLIIVQGDSLAVNLVAPFDGTVLSVDAIQGDRIAGGTVLTLADMSHPMVEVYVDEVELDYAEAGNKAEIVFDAYPNEVFTGQVEAVDPTLADSFEVTGVLVRVRLDETSSTPSMTLPDGLNATVDIIAAQVDNAVLVPVVALHESESGGYVVYVIQGDEIERRQVTVGIMDYTTAQILDGLFAGESVALSNIEGEQ